MSKYAYAYFDTNGELKEFILDPSVRQGNSNINKIYVYWDHPQEFSMLAKTWINTDLADAEWSTPELVSTTELEFVIPVNQDYEPKFFKYGQPYMGYLVTIPEEALVDNANIALDLVTFDSDDDELDPTDSPIMWLGPMTFHVSGSGASFPVEIDKSQYYLLLDKINNIVEGEVYGIKLNGADVPLVDGIADIPAYSKTGSDARYVQKYTETGGWNALAYCRVKDGNNYYDSMLTVDSYQTGNTIVKRNSSGQIKAGTPTENSDVTTKYYVDNAIAAASLGENIPASYDSETSTTTITGKFEQTVANDEYLFSPIVPSLQGMTYDSDHSFVKCKVINGVMYVIAEAVITNGTGSALSDIQIQFQSASIPNKYANKIYRIDGSKLSQSVPAEYTIENLIICGTSCQKTGLSSGTTSSLIPTYLEGGNESKLNIFVKANWAVGEKALLSLRIPLILL